MTISAELARDIWRKLFFISARLRTTSYGILDKKIECSFAQFPIIQFFFSYPDATPAMKDLTSYVGFPSGAVSQAVECLVQASVLERIPSEKDHRSTLIRATDEMRAVRDKAMAHFQKMFDAFKSCGYATAEEIAFADDIFVRLAESRTGGELSAVKNPADLATPGLIRHRFIDPEKLKTLPTWILTLHFTSVLKGPTLVYYYGTKGRMTLGKIRLLDHIFLLSETGESPKVKDLAARFQVSSGVASQTLNAMIQDGVVERVATPQDHRIIRIRLTPKGLRLRRQTSASYTHFMQNFFSTAEPEKVRLFSSILDRFLEYLEKEGKAFLLPETDCDHACPVRITPDSIP